MRASKDDGGCSCGLGIIGFFDLSLLRGRVTSKVPLEVEPPPDDDKLETTAPPIPESELLTDEWPLES